MFFFFYHYALQIFIVSVFFNFYFFFKFLNNFESNKFALGDKALLISKSDSFWVLTGTPASARTPVPGSNFATPSINLQGKKEIYHLICMIQGGNNSFE